MNKEEAIERLKQNKAAAEFYAGMVQNTNAIENELKDIEAIDMAIEALQIDLLRCKDCRHRETDDCPMYWVEWSIFEDCDGYTDDKYIVHDYTTDDGYCNYGERKES